MVSIIENKAKIEGKILSFNKDAGPHGFSQIEVKLHQSEDVEGFPNLAKADEGQIITVNVRQEDMADINIQTGANFSARVRKAFGQKYFVDSFST